MNSYNENLRSTIAASLQSLELDQKNIKAQANASMFTLYYAEGATITALEHCEQSNDTLIKNEKLKTQAVMAVGISNNQLASSTEINQYVKQSVTNAAICAANMQVASNAIVRLASDMGSIFSIVNAADADTDIFQQAKEALDKINETANEAEKVSQNAMNASMLTSQVSASTVLDKSKTTNTAMNNVCKTAADEYSAAVQLVADKNAALDAAITSEKLAEGNYLDCIAADTATNSAYITSNKLLNLGLSVTDQNVNSFTVTFNQVRNVFEQKNLTSPVKEYYIIVVKENKKMIFSLADAEKLVKDTSDKTGFKKYIAVAAAGNEKQLLPIEQQIDFKHIALPHHSKFILQDSDGENITAAASYVVFVMAVYSDDYKKQLNDFEDYLSAPSNSFICMHELATVDVNTIYFDTTPTSQTLHFKVTEDPALLQKKIVEYRCILLPSPNKDAIDFLFNKKLAEQVMAGNYINAVQDLSYTSHIKQHTFPETLWSVIIDEAATDNFGNPLTGGRTYIPVILSYANAIESEMNLYMNNWSGYMGYKNEQVFKMEK